MVEVTMAVGRLRRALIPALLGGQARTEIGMAVKNG
jgi:hypothetical protein